VIRTFRDRGLKELFETGSSRKLPADALRRIEIRLDVLNAALSPAGVNVPGFGLHPLKGARAGDWAITVTRNYRITFRFEGEDVFDVNWEDYH
jgi:proteic killer suppression protein